MPSGSGFRALLNDVSRECALNFCIIEMDGRNANYFDDLSYDWIILLWIKIWLWAYLKLKFDRGSKLT